MGRLTNALEKAGYEGGVQKNQPPSVEEPVVNEENVKSEKEVKTSSIRNISRSAPSRMTAKWDERLHKSVNQDYHSPEVFKVLRSRILHPMDNKPVPKTIMITSCVPGEGKSFVAANLGISYAQGLDQYALIVDCDLRTPSLNSMFGLRDETGIVDYLRDDVELSTLIRKTSVNKLSVLPGGIPPVNPSELLSSNKMEKLVNHLSTRYEDRIIIFDSPPILYAAESSVLAEHVDGIILVVRQGKAGKAQVNKFIEMMGENRILGLVFNDHSTTFLEKKIAKGHEYPFHVPY